jgi:ABC-type branched-subunit amino acid transport system substrate-binding protein
MKRGALRGAVCGLAAAAALTACSSGPAATPDDHTTGGATPSGTVATTSQTARGDAINLVFLTQNTTLGSSGDGFTGIQAAIRYVNAHGGIGGRPLAATECADNGDPNLAASCATKAADNPGVIASVGQITLEGSVADPVLQHAGLPSVGALANTSADFNSPVVFAPTIGGLSGLGAVAAATDLLRSKKVSLVYDQNPAAATELGLIDSVVLKPRHLPDVTGIAVSPTAGDMSAAVAAASQGSPGAIVLYMSQAQGNSFVKAARQQGVQTPILVSALLESVSAVKQQLSGGQGIYFYTSFNHSGHFYDDFQSQWQAAGNAPALADEFAINGWLAVTTFTAVARTLPSVTRASVLAAFGRLRNYSTDGLLPPLSFDKPSTILAGQATRIINPTMGLSQYQNGAFVPYAGGRFTNPFVLP